MDIVMPWLAFFVIVGCLAAIWAWLIDRDPGPWGDEAGPWP